MVSFLQDVDGFKGDLFLVNPNIRHYLFKGKILPKLPYKFVLFDSPQMRNLMISVGSPRGLMAFVGKISGHFCDFDKS